MALREDRIGQTWLVPRRVINFIPDDHICFFIANLVEGLDFKKNERKHKYTKGKPAYSRHMLNRLVIMASVDGIFSSRKIIKLAEENMIYNYNNVNMHQYYTNKCLNCPNQVKCAGKDRIKIITDYGDILSKRMALKMETENGKIEFAKRKQTVEWPFRNLKHTEYLTHRIKQTQTENNLICISHNKKRIHNQQQQNQTNLINT